MKPRGYIALDRGVHEHHVFRNRDHWFRAWTWLIARAAWKAEGQRGGWGVAHVERGQIATTVRDLGTTWGWPKSNVDRFLRRLAREGMVVLTKCGTTTGTASGTALSYPITIITICNYDKFQKASKAAASEAGQQAGQEPGQESQASLPLQGLPAPEPFNPSTKVNSEKAVVEKRGERWSRDVPPRDGTRSRKHGTIYYRKGSPEWKAYTDDFKNVRGASPLPDRHGGFWFCYLGEASRPSQQRGWRRA